MNAKNLVILLIITLLVLGVTWLVTQPSKVSNNNQAVIYPELMSTINDIDEIRLAKEKQSFTMRRKDGQWSVQEKSGYPANLDKIRQLLISIAELKYLEAKTSDPKLYDKISVEDIKTENAQSIQVTLKKGQDTLVDLLIGKDKSHKKQVYLRKMGDKQSWLATGMLSIDRESTDWLDKKIVDVAKERIRQVDISRFDGDKILISKSKFENEGYDLADIPEDMEVKMPSDIDDIAGLLADLTLEDVIEASKVNFETSTQAEFISYDGMKVTLSATTVDGKNYAKLVAAAVPATKTRPEKKEGQKEDDKSSKYLKTEAEVKQDIESLNKKFKTWAFALPQYKMNILAKKRDDLLKKKEIPESSMELSNPTTSKAQQDSPLVIKEEKKAPSMLSAFGDVGTR